MDFLITIKKGFDIGDYFHLQSIVKAGILHTQYDKSYLPSIKVKQSQLGIMISDSNIMLLLTINQVCQLFAKYDTSHH